ncbi:hypothetical protein NL676_018096 [Syzygium grande]|nr:hypothetical protein NL676_018096 [Syzygium grande]
MKGRKSDDVVVTDAVPGLGDDDVGGLVAVLRGERLGDAEPAVPAPTTTQSTSPPPAALGWEIAGPSATKHRIPASPMAAARPRRRPDLGGAARPRPDLHEVERRPTSSRSGAREGLWARNGRVATEEEGRWRGRVAMGGAARPRPDLHEVERRPTSSRSGAREGLWARNGRVATKEEG